MFKQAYLTACSTTPRIEVKDNRLEPQNHDQRYLEKPYSEGYTDGCGSLRNPYKYKSAAPVSAYYEIVDLWSRFRPTLNTPAQANIYIQVNDWVFQLTTDGVVYEGRHIKFL